MPACQNGSGYYRGDEPSPRGFGLCAHNEKLGAETRGVDGSVWCVKRRTSGSHYWARKVHGSDPMPARNLRGKGGNFRTAAAAARTAIREICVTRRRPVALKQSKESSVRVARKKTSTAKKISVADKRVGAKAAKTTTTTNRKAAATAKLAAKAGARVAAKRAAR